MRSARIVLVCLAVAASLTLIGPAAALASNCGGSAGDSQYVDPLQNCGGGTSSGSAGSGGGGSGTHSSGSSASSSPSPTTIASSTTPTAGPTATVASTTTTTQTTSASSTPAKAGAGTLPFTGLPLGPVLALAVVMIGGGLFLRRITA